MADRALTLWRKSAGSGELNWREDRRQLEREVARRLRFWRTRQYGDGYPIDTVVKRGRTGRRQERKEERGVEHAHKQFLSFFSTPAAYNTILHSFASVLSRSPSTPFFVIVRSNGCHAHRTNTVVVVGPRLSSFFFILRFLLSLLLFRLHSLSSTPSSSLHLSPHSPVPPHSLC